MKEKNIFKILSIEAKNKKVEYRYEAEGKWREIIKKNNLFSLEYTRDISGVPKSVLAIPLLCNILPIAWVIDGIIEVPECDKDFVNCLPDVKRGYEEMYPNFSFGGKIIVSNIVDSKTSNEKKALTLFSGGIDAFFSLVRHLDVKPILFTIWGADIQLDDLKGWDNVKKHIEITQKYFELEAETVRSTFREFFIAQKLNQYISETKENWWHGFQHGMGIIGHTAPIAYLMNVSTVFIASSFTEKEKGFVTCASDPSIDSQIRFCGIKVIHDGYECSRQQKVHFLCQFSKKTGIYPTFRVCWESDGGKNCCACEKCYRTIYGIVSEGEDPEKFGFTVTPEVLSEAEKKIKKWYYFDPVLVTYWTDIQNSFKEHLEIGKLYPDTQWIIKYDFSKTNKSWEKKIRNSSAGKLYKKIKRRFLKIIK